MGFFDNISGLLSSNDEEKNKINSLYGVPQGVVDEANGGTMMGLGGLLMAAGQRQTPAQRAQWLSQIGNVSNSRDSNIYKAAQARLMMQKANEPKDAYKTETDNEGNVWQINTRNGQRDLLKAAPDPLTTEYKRAQISALANKTVDPVQAQIQRDQNKSQIKEQEKQKAVIDSAKNIQPIINDALDAYQQLHSLGDIGPIQGSKWWRNTGAGWGTEAEALKQKYDLAMAKLNLMDAPFKGQGAVSDYERKLQERSYPTLSMSDSSVGLNDLLQRKQMVDRRASGNFSAISEPQVNSNPLAKAKAAIDGGANRELVIKRLRENGIDPKGL